MINLKNIKSLFVVDPEEPDSKDGKKNPDAKPSGDARNTPVPASGAVDDRIMNSLLLALEKNNLAGFDFLEFKNSLKALSAMPLDEATKFRSAFATAATVGVTVKSLVDSGNHYLSVLDTEKTNFKSELAQQIKDNVTAKQKLVEQLANTIKTKSDQIKQLTSEINAHQSETGKLQIMIADSTNKFQSTESSFNLTLDSLVNQINQDIDKIKTYLNPPEK